MPRELFLAIKEVTKIRNAFANNMSTDIKLGKTQFFQFSNWAVKRKASSKYYFRILSNSIGNLCK